MVLQFPLPSPCATSLLLPNNTEGLPFTSLALKLPFPLSHWPVPTIMGWSAVLLHIPPPHVTVCPDDHYRNVLQVARPSSSSSPATFSSDEGNHLVYCKQSSKGTDLIVVNVHTTKRKTLNSSQEVYKTKASLSYVWPK